MAFDFQNLDIYKKAKAFHLDCRALMAANKLDNYGSSSKPVEQVIF